jgi:hypothetical protein
MNRPGRPKHHHDPVEEMAVFDELPAVIRAALNHSTVKYLGIASMRRFAGMDRDEVTKVARLIRAGKLPATLVDADCN